MVQNSQVGTDDKIESSWENDAAQNQNGQSENSNTESSNTETSNKESAPNQEKESAAITVPENKTMEAEDNSAISAEGSTDAAVDESGTDRISVQIADDNNSAQNGRKLLRAARSADRTAEFNLSAFTIKINNTIVYENGSVVGDASESDATSNPQISFDFSLIQNNPSQHDFVDGDTIRIKVLDVKKNSSSTIFSGQKPQTNLYGKVNGIDLLLATMSLETVTTSDTEMSLYCVIKFTSNIEGKNNISASGSGYATVKASNQGDQIVISRDDNQLAEINKKPVDTTPSTSTVYFPSNDTSEPATGKRISAHVASSDSVNMQWILEFYKYFNQQFTDYETKKNGGTVTYSNLILEETLDSYQTFTTRTNNVKPNSTANPKGLEMQINLPIYLYSENRTDGKLYPYASYPSYGAQVSVGSLFFDDPAQISSSNGCFYGFTYIDGDTDPIAAEAKVRDTPKTWTIITEQDTDVPSRNRERLLINWGAPGSTGARYAEVMGPDKWNELLGTMESDANLYRKIVTDNSSKLDTDLVVYNSISMSLEKWKEASKILDDSLAFYKENPYIYGFRAVLKARTIPGDADSYTQDEYKNTYTMSGGMVSDRDEYSATYSNKWAGKITAKPANGEVLIFKADSTYQVTEEMLANTYGPGSGGSSSSNGSNITKPNSSLSSPAKSAKTGDETAIATWLMLLAAASMCMIVVYRKKRCRMSNKDI